MDKIEKEIDSIKKELEKLRIIIEANVTEFLDGEEITPEEARGRISFLEKKYEVYKQKNILAEIKSAISKEEIPEKFYFTFSKKSYYALKRELKRAYELRKEKKSKGHGTFYLDCKIIVLEELKEKAYGEIGSEIPDDIEEFYIEYAKSYVARVENPLQGGRVNPK